MFAEVNGIRLYYESAGSGPPVVLVHGLGLSGDMWRYQMPALAERHRVITVDTRGHGRTSKPPGPYEMSMYVEDVRQLLDVLGVDKAVLIGLSMGGGIVQCFGLAHLERLIALGLISTGNHAGHFCYREQPETFNHVIRGFVDKVSRKSIS
jgi:pimeloyl-ACP methyl ester carboxylesterase